MNDADFMRSVLDGWDGIDVPADDGPDLVDEHDVAFARTFSGEYGEKVLSYLRRRTLDEPSWVPGQPTDNGAWREGQNSIVREIVRRRERARNVID